MKHLFFKSMAGIIAMVSTSLSAQSMEPDETIGQSNPFTITKVKYQDEDEMSNKSFTGTYFLNLAATGAEVNTSTDDYIYGSEGCLYFNTDAGFLDMNLHLPDGHEILGMRYYFKDGSADSSRAQLYIAPSNGPFSSLIAVESTGNSGTYLSDFNSPATPHFVNNAKNAYVIRFYTSVTGSDQQMCGVRLFMDTP